MPLASLLQLTQMLLAVEPNSNMVQSRTIIAEVWTQRTAAVGSGVFDGERLVR
ncbi:hypothetical protein SAMD00023353_0103260 [Rosellinia necatrix]|uniref:Uncharacterized protein n=1 Tax=Rosellinia necatrix TaxID=77044 RepID=A0A1S8A4P6_ROSNE|nr:hypothetical protein SAMD00023353_0103260 [Rosellinia necatrix]